MWAGCDTYVSARSCHCAAILCSTWSMTCVKGSVSITGGIVPSTASFRCRSVIVRLASEDSVGRSTVEVDRRGHSIPRTCYPKDISARVRDVLVVIVPQPMMATHMARVSLLISKPETHGPKSTSSQREVHLYTPHTSGAASMPLSAAICATSAVFADSLRR